MFKLNKKITLIILTSLILLTILILVYFLIIRKTNTPTPKANKPEIENRVTILQNDVYIFPFSTEEIKETKNLVHLRIWPVLSFTTNSNIKSLKLKNVYVNPENKYETAIIYPGHVPNNRSQYNILFGEKEEIKEKDIRNYGTTLEYNIVENAGYYDEVYKTSGIPQWLIVLKNIGEYNYTEIYNRDRFWDGGKILEYANLQGKDLNLSFTFDLEILFEDGERYIKRFSSTIEGEKYLQDQFYNPKLTY